MIRRPPRSTLTATLCPYTALCRSCRGRRVHEAHAETAQAVDRLQDVVAAERYVLDALALVRVEILLDLALLVGGFVDRDAALAARAGHRLGLQPGQLALDVDVADLLEVEELLVESGPGVHAPAVDDVGQVVDVGVADALGVQIGRDNV